MRVPNTIGGQLATSLRSQVERVARYRRRVLGRGEAEDVHRLRVASRRLGLGIELAHRAFELPPEVGSDVMLAIGSRFGRARDSAVARATLIDVGLTAKGRVAATAEQLATRVARRERRQLTRARRELRRARIGRLLLVIQRALRRPILSPIGRQPIETGHDLLVRPLEAEVVAHGAWSIPVSGPTERSRQADRARHELRIRIKRLRDAILLLGGTPDAQGETIDRLNLWAGALGELRDLGKLYREVEGESPVLTRLVGARLARACQQWDSLRISFLNVSSFNLQDQPTTPPISSLRTSQSA